MYGAGGGWVWYLPAPGPTCGIGGGGGGDRVGVLGVVGVGVVDGSNPKVKNLSPLPVEVWGRLPPGASHKEGRG